MAKVIYGDLTPLKRTQERIRDMFTGAGLLAAILITLLVIA